MKENVSTFGNKHCVSLGDKTHFVHKSGGQMIQSLSIEGNIRSSKRENDRVRIKCELHYDLCYELYYDLAEIRSRCFHCTHRPHAEARLVSNSRLK